ncbi:MAG TPA: metallophosphoesterase [Tepidisphaeraceae bacterium]|jgi:Icc protein
MVRFVHLTDTHLGATPYFSLYGRQTLAALQRVVSVINDFPFEIDFVLHTGDVADDGSSEAYQLAREAMGRLKAPVKYVAGNHDDAERLQRIVIGDPNPLPRLDYVFDVRGVRVVVLDTRGPVDPAGFVEPQQLQWLRTHCTFEGPPLVVAMHHSPVELDTPWLDTPPPGWNGKHMFIDNAAELLDVLRPARLRLRGVFSGHVHGAFQVMRDGILFVSGQSTFGPLTSLPDTDRPVGDSTQLPLFNIVTVTEDSTIVRPRVVLG